MKVIATTIFLGFFAFSLLIYPTASLAMGGSLVSAAIAPADQTLALNQSGTFNIALNVPTSQQIQSWQFYVDYNANVIQINNNDIELGPAFAALGWQPISSEVHQEGSRHQVRVNYYAPPGADYFTQTGNQIPAVIVHFQTVGSGLTNLQFQPDIKSSAVVSQVVVPGPDDILEGATTDGQIRVSGVFPRMLVYWYTQVDDFDWYPTPPDNLVNSLDFAQYFGT